jgi:hypothetical protein
LPDIDLKVGTTSVSFSPVSHLFLLPSKMGYSICDLAEKFVFVNAAEDREKGLLPEVEYYDTMKDLDNRHNHCHHPPVLELDQIE